MQVDRAICRLSFGVFYWPYLQADKRGIIGDRDLVIFSIPPIALFSRRDSRSGGDIFPGRGI